MAWTTARILQKLSSHRVQRQSSTSTPKGSSGKTPGSIESLESESGTPLNMDGFPSASKGPYMERLFSKWLQDQGSIHGTWQRFFRDLVETKAPSKFNHTPSAKSDSNVSPGSKSPTPGQGEPLPQPPKLGSVLLDQDLSSKNSKKMTSDKPQEKIQREPETAAKGNLKAPLRTIRRIPRFGILHKFTKIRGEASPTNRIDKSLQRAQQISKSKSRLERRSKANFRKNNTFSNVSFKNYYEEQQNREKAKQSKLRRSGGKNVSKKNRLITKPETTNSQEKPQLSQQQPRNSPLGEDNNTLNYLEENNESGDNDPSPNPKTRTYESLEALIDDLDNATADMACFDPIHQEKVKKFQLWNDGETSEKKYQKKDLPEKSLKSEDKVLIDQDKASAKPTKGTKNLSTEGLQSPLDNGSEDRKNKNHPSGDP